MDIKETLEVIAAIEASAVTIKAAKKALAGIQNVDDELKDLSASELRQIIAAAFAAGKKVVEAITS